MQPKSRMQADVQVLRNTHAKNVRDSRNVTCRLSGQRVTCDERAIFMRKVRKRRATFMQDSCSALDEEHFAHQLHVCLTSLASSSRESRRRIACSLRICHTNAACAGLVRRRSSSLGRRSASWAMGGSAVLSCRYQQLTVPPSFVTCAVVPGGQPPPDWPGGGAIMPPPPPPGLLPPPPPPE